MLTCVCVSLGVCSVTQSCPTLCDPMDCSPPGSSVHGISQARILEWVAISSSRWPSQPRDRTCISCVSCIAGRFFTTEPLDHNELWKIHQEMGIPDHLICLLRNLYVGQEAQLELDMEQQTGSKLGKKYIKAVYCHPVYLTYMKSASWEMPGWMKHSWNQDCREKYQ